MWNTGGLGFVYLFITLQLCVCVCVLFWLLHTHILERRRSAALCMMRLLVGYDLGLASIHIHARLPGRVCIKQWLQLWQPTFTGSTSCSSSSAPAPRLGFFFSPSGSESESRLEVNWSNTLWSTSLWSPLPRSCWVRSLWTCILEIRTEETCQSERTLMSSVGRTCRSPHHLELQ